MNSNQKGKRGERELAKFLREHTGRGARRSQQYCGNAGDQDVLSDALPNLHIESKRVESLNIHNAIHQAMSDCSPGKTPCVCHKRNRGEWLITMRLEDYLKTIGFSASSEIPNAIKNPVQL